ncbi:Zinc finger protein BRUTUS-like At1g74770 [Linum perenne]
MGGSGDDDDVVDDEGSLLSPLDDYGYENNREEDEEEEVNYNYEAEFEVEGELFSGVSLADAPILFLLCFHRAFRRELAELCRIAVAASESGGGGGRGGSAIDELRCRFEFLKLAYDYHSAAEDEVIFLALDVHVKNVVCAYSLEHKSIDDAFDTVSRCLKLLMEEKEESSSEPFQELVSCLSIIHSSICHHMLKEEKQVFPLLVERFSPKEQASLVWQFLCSIPVILLEDFLPWMISLSPENQVDVTLCIKEIVPDGSLQEVVISWLQKRAQFPSRDLTNTAGRGHTPHLIFSARCSEEHWQLKTTDSVHAKEGHIIHDCFHLWHGVIIKSLLEILEELYQIRSGSLLDVDPTLVRLKFLADVVTFYSNALKKFFDPVLSSLATDHFTGLYAAKSPDESNLERIQQLLHDNTQNNLPAHEFMEKICQGMQVLVVEVSKQFKFLEAKVFPLLINNCGQEMQLELFLYMSFGMMPLGLLKFVITWFAACLSKHELGPILQGLKQGESLASKSFLSLLHEWLLIGYSGKISIDDFGKDLQRMFDTRSSFLTERPKEDVRFSSLPLNLKPCEASPHDKTEPLPLYENKLLSPSSLSFDFDKAKTYQASYSREINLHVFFPQTARLRNSVPKIPDEESSSASTMDEPIPLEFMLFFNKALKKDLENLVLYSAQLAENFGFLKEFCQHFNLLRHQYKFHSDAEDEWIFPLLEAKGQAENISHSYTIDHKLEVHNFQKIAIILEEMNGLQMSVSIGTHKQARRIMRRNHLCLKLQRRCKSIQKLLSDHIHHEEIELWPVIKQRLTIQEQEKVVASILGRTRAETLQVMIPWLIGSLKPEEQVTVMSLWRKVTKDTNFSDWLGEWWEVCDKAPISDELSSSCDTDSLETVYRYLSSESPDQQDDSLSNRSINFPQKDSNGANMVGDSYSKDNTKIAAVGEEDECLDCIKVLIRDDKKTCNEVDGITDEKENPAQPFQETLKSIDHEPLSSISQDDFDAALRRISRDSSLDPQKKSRLMQNLQTSRWLIQKQMYHTSEIPTTNEKVLQGQHPSYQDPVKLTLGCKHYKRNCKLFAECCNQLYTCLRCHDELADHSVDRRAIEKMMCMNCLIIQPIQQTCATISCNNLSMAKYYCKICKLFDDGREIYHCPFCNICRVGKGLGMDYFHCMKCNACMSKSLAKHICREKCFDDNCPICRESIFTSSIPVKALPCGHLMHSPCFQDYTCNHYICPICSKSLGDMKVYFKMLDALLAEERTPDEYSSQSQKGSARFHWVYHKCSLCGSYNTRLL